MSNWWEQAAAAAASNLSSMAQKASDHLEAQGGLQGMVGTAKSTVGGMDVHGNVQGFNSANKDANQLLQEAIGAEKGKVASVGDNCIDLLQGEVVLRIIDDMQIDLSEMLRVKVRGRGVITNYRFVLKIFKSSWQPCVWWLYERKFFEFPLTMVLRVEDSYRSKENMPGVREWTATVHTKDGRRIVCVVPNEEAQSKFCELSNMSKLQNGIFARAYGATQSDIGWSLYDAEVEYMSMGVGTAFHLFEFSKLKMFFSLVFIL